MQNLERTGQNLLEAIAYGDAAGIAVEYADAADIEARHGRVNKLLAPMAHPHFVNEKSPGVWTDDTQLSLAVAEGLIIADGFDLNTQAETFIQAYRETPQVFFEDEWTPRGWGGSTTRSAERLIAGVSPVESGEPDGAGNGVVMKLGPLALWQAMRGTTNDERYVQYDALTTMTHDSDVARWATRLHGDFLLRLLSTSEHDKLELVEYIQDRTHYHESELGLDDSNSQLLAYLQQTVDHRSILRHTDGRGFYVPQTLAMAYGAFFAAPPDFSTAVYEAVNLGGDTDSIASITANMVNFYKKGDIVLPKDAELLQDRPRLREVSKSLTNLAMKGAKV